MTDYDTDIALWSEHQARLLRLGILHHLLYGGPDSQNRLLNVNRPARQRTNIVPSRWRY